MEKTEALNRIDEKRTEIDEIDREIVALLNQRAKRSLEIRRLKPAAEMQLFDESREDAIYSKVCKVSSGELYDEGLKEIYSVLLRVMKENPDATSDEIR